MDLRIVTTWNRLSVVAILSITVLLTTLSGEAGAACSTTAGTTPFTGAAMQVDGRSAATFSLDEKAQPGSRDWIVGMWLAEFLIGEGPDRYDQGFQQFHSDGTETMLSNGLPPSLGNVCLGVWKQVGSRTLRLKHVAWNWNADGSFAGSFVMLVTLKVNRRGDSYEGTWTADSFDPSNNVIPELHVAGVVRATRISVD